MDIAASPLVKTFLVMALALPLVAACRGARPGASSGLDALFARRIDPGGPGAAVLVVKDGRPVLEGGYGVRELRTGQPIGARTNFRLASVTKQFTAAAVMLLVRDGRLDYEARLNDIFPDFADYGRAITVR